MLETADIVRSVLQPFLVVGGVLLAILIGFLFIQRAARSLALRRHRILTARYRPLIDVITQVGLTPQALARLLRAPASHRSILAELLLAPLHAARGEVTVHVRDAAIALGLVRDWVQDLQHRHWWRRADGARALGFVNERAALPAILRTLEDDHREVRAAAVDATGRMGDARAIPALLALLSDASQYQRVRVVDALRGLGPGVTPALVELGQHRPDHARLAAEVLGLIGTADAIDPLLDWCSDTRSDVRAAALNALGTLGLDDRSYYFALRALGDADANTRAMAARALGRVGRVDAAGYLAARLDDEWLPAAQAAGALRQLGEHGRAALAARADDRGQAGDLARQMLWSRPATPAVL